MSFENEIKLGETFLELPKSKFQVQHADNNGQYPFYTSGDKILTHSEFNLNDDIIFLATGGKANIKFNSGKAAYSTDTFAIKGKEHSSKYLYYLLLNKLSYIDRNFFSGSGLKHLQKKDFRNWLHSFPKDSNEEERIVQILSTLDNVIAATEQLIYKYQRIKTGLLHDLLTKGIDGHGNLRNVKTHKFKDSKLGRIPEEWEIERLSILAEISSGITLGKKHEGTDIVELPYLRVANVQDGYLDLNEITTICLPKNQVARFKLEVGDVLMNEGGDFDKLGRGTIWQGQIPLCLHQNHVFKVRTNREKLIPEFLEMVSQSPYGKKFFILSSKQSTNLASINSTQLKAFPIPLPKVDEQKLIVKIYSSLNSNINNQTEGLSKLKSLKTGLMQDLLSGKVRVNI